jgi:hypothetical protein
MKKGIFVSTLPEIILLASKKNAVNVLETPCILRILYQPVGLDP